MTQTVNRILLLVAIYISTSCTPTPTVAPSETAIPITTSTPANEKGTPTSTATYVSPTPISTATSDNGLLDLNCRTTIIAYFSYRKGFSEEFLRSLFVDPNYVQIESLIKYPPSEPLTILDLAPAQEWWSENHPSTPIPSIFYPEDKKEHIYVVKYTGNYEPNERPLIIYPRLVNMTMVEDSPPELKGCKIKEIGSG